MIDKRTQTASLMELKKLAGGDLSFCHTWHTTGRLAADVQTDGCGQHLSLASQGCPPQPGPEASAGAFPVPTPLL